MSETRLSLFQIESELLQLIDQREDALERCLGASTPGKHEEAVQEIAVLDGLIRDYLKREVKKVDNIAGLVKELDASHKAKSEAAADLQRKADRDAETAKRIKQMVLEVMQQFGEKKLPGRLFTISRQGNGGVQALTIVQPDLVPDPFKTATVRMSLRLLRMFVKELSEVDCREMYGTVADPDPKLIREALERGEGVMGCRLEPRAEHIRIK